MTIVRRLFTTICIALSLTGGALAQGTDVQSWTKNAEMTAIFEADQAARQAGPDIDWEVVSREDEARRVRTKALLDAGALQSGDDFYHAAFVFQLAASPRIICWRTASPLSPRRAGDEALRGSRRQRWTAICNQSARNRFTARNIVRAITSPRPRNPMIAR